jgi:hypothetical protein
MRRCTRIDVRIARLFTLVQLDAVAHNDLANPMTTPAVLQVPLEEVDL